MNVLIHTNVDAWNKKDKPVSGPTNVGRMLRELGYQAPPKKSGLASPAVIISREVSYDGLSAMVETRTEIEAEIDSRKTVGQRSTTKRSPGNWE